MRAVKLWGGLGNQMFQYAFGKYLEEKFKEEVSFYTIPYRSTFDCDLSGFRVKLKCAPDSLLKKNLIFFQGEYGYRLERKMVQKFPGLNPYLFVENSLKFHPEISSKPILFDGYWQSYKYPEKISALITSEFRPGNEIEQSLLPRITQIGSPQSVSVHIRRGDYLQRKNDALFCRCSPEYYIKAMEYFKEVLGKPVFYIFSDDPVLVQDELKLTGLYDLHYVDNSDYTPVYLADFLMMSQCSHHIIANSTFSWWAAWLNPNPDKTVIAPRQWYRGELNDTTVDLIPPEWIRM